jgi:predicted ABC-type ATPase
VTKPRLLVIAGPNGSGKTALTQGGELTRHGILLPDHYINADDIARSLRTAAPDRPQIEIDRQAQGEARKLRRTYREQGVSFAFETVFSHPSSLLDMQKCRASGYEVVLAYVVTAQVEINLGRIQGRVLAGGHDVPEDKVRTRYERCLHYLPRLVEEADRALVFDSTAEGQTLLCFQKRRFSTDIAMPQYLEERLATVLKARTDQRSFLQAQFGVLSAPEIEAGVYSGPLFTVTPQFAVQQTSLDLLVLHDRLLIEADLQTGVHADVRYIDGLVRP